MSLILYLIIGPVLWCAYTAWAAHHWPNCIWNPGYAPDVITFVFGLLLWPIFWPIGLAIFLFCALGSWLYDLLTP